MDIALYSFVISTRNQLEMKLSFIFYVCILATADCEFGKQPDPGDFNKCKDCPIGTYSDMTGSYACTKCPYGYTTYSTGSTSKDKCFGE